MDGGPKERMDKRLKMDWACRCFISVLHMSINDHLRDSWGVKGCDDYSLCKPIRQNRVQVVHVIGSVECPCR